MEGIVGGGESGDLGGSGTERHPGWRFPPHRARAIEGASERRFRCSAGVRARGGKGTVMTRVSPVDDAHVRARDARSA